jgi:hypothetical protein
VDDRLVALVRFVDDSEIVATDRLKSERVDLLCTFVGSTREQVVRAVEQQDLSLFDLERLYREVDGVSS